MKLTLNSPCGYITLVTETPEDMYLLGRIAAKLNQNSFSVQSESRSLDIQIKDLVKALAQ